MWPFNRKKYSIKKQHAMYYLIFETIDNIDILTPKCYKNIIVESLIYCIQNKGLQLYAYVIVNNQVQLIAKASQPNIGLSDIIRDFKKYTSKLMLEYITNPKEDKRNNWLEALLFIKGQQNPNNEMYQVWKQQPYGVLIDTVRLFYSKIEYMHLLPVINGLVSSADDYLFSSAVYLSQASSKRLFNKLSFHPNTSVNYL